MDHLMFLSFLLQTAIDPAHSAKLIGAGLAIGLGAIGPGIGLGIGTWGATQAIGRNPDAEGPIPHSHDPRPGLRRSVRYLRTRCGSRYRLRRLVTSDASYPSHDCHVRGVYRYSL